MDDQAENQHQKQYHWLEKHQWKPGQSGNPNGRPPGKSLKTFVREYFENLDDDAKMDFLAKIDPKTAWEMAEGKPDTKNQTDLTSQGEKIVFLPAEVINRMDETTPETE